MLDWIKRIAASGPREEAEAETSAKVERLATRLHTNPGAFDHHHAPAMADQDVVAPPPVASTIEAVVASLPPTAPSVVALPAPAPVMPAASLVVAAPVTLPAVITERLPARPATAKIIAVVSQKGGSGKTTVAAHLAVRAAAVGDGPVMLIDTDPQHSLSDWHRARDDDSLQLATLDTDELPAALARGCGRGAATIIIDTPPALTQSIEQVLAIADFVIVPARPSPHDLRAVGATVGMARAAKKPFAFVVNGAAPRANITAEAVAALSEHGRVAPIILYQRTEFAASMIDGRTVMESSVNGRSAQEIADLWKYVSAQMRVREAA